MEQHGLQGGLGTKGPVNVPKNVGKSVFQGAMEVRDSNERLSVVTGVGKSR